VLTLAQVYGQAIYNITVGRGFIRLCESLVDLWSFVLFNFLNQSPGGFYYVHTGHYCYKLYCVLCAKLYLAEAVRAITKP